MSKATKHIDYIDALKGLAAIMVFMGHFMLAFPLLQNISVPLKSGPVKY